MPYMWNPVRALIQLDDRVLGRWLDHPRRPMPLSSAIALTVAVAIFAVLFAALTGYVGPPLGTLICIAAGWYLRARNARRSG
jgi:hypothetical protein